MTILCKCPNTSGEMQAVVSEVPLAGCHKKKKKVQFYTCRLGYLGLLIIVA